MTELVPRELLDAVLEANVTIPRLGLSVLTWGNASGVDRASGIFVIKPSGLRYSELTRETLVAVELETGRVLGGTMKPSTDSETHRLLYNTYPDIGGVTHTHSTYAVAFAQARRAIPMVGTTHADTFNGDVPVTRDLQPAECATEYELNTGRAIVEAINASGRTPLEVPGALAANHGPFTWGRDAVASTETALICETVAKMAWLTLALNPSALAPPHLLERHFTRKHGPGAYYGNAPA